MYFSSRASSLAMRGEKTPSLSFISFLLHSPQTTFVILDRIPTCLFMERSCGRSTSAGNGVDRVHLSCVCMAWGLLIVASCYCNQQAKDKTQNPLKVQCVGLSGIEQWIWSSYPPHIVVRRRRIYGGLSWPLLCQVAVGIAKGCNRLWQWWWWSLIDLWIGLGYL